MLAWCVGHAQTDASAGSVWNGNKDTNLCRNLLVLRRRRRLRRGFWRWRKVLLAHIHRLPVAAREPHINSIPFRSGKSVLVTLVRLFVLADRDLYLVRRHCRSVRAFYIFLQAYTCDTSTGAFVAFEVFGAASQGSTCAYTQCPRRRHWRVRVLSTFLVQHPRAAPVPARNACGAGTGALCGLDVFNATSVPAGNASDAGIGVFKRDFVQ